ncbi:MAG TPA: cation:proton antiporter [Lactovum miscens]|uniref:cation:proton antiporter n=1 Tax=Lactovum miscens TaxID=190387 RepID=UPI002EDA24AC
MSDILQITIILIASLIATICSKRLKIPAVVGQMLVGIILSPSVLNWIHGGQTIEVLSEIGVILLMFLAGIESDLSLLKKNFKFSMLVAIAGVIGPLIVFWLVAQILNYTLTASFFYGIVFAATSVSITVEVLQEYGKLSTKAGSIILGAAVVDDILAIFLLSIFSSTQEGNANLIVKFGLEILFFLFLFLFHRILPRLWKFVEMIPVYAKHTTVALILCLSLSLLATAVGMSAVIGAFFVGLAVSQTELSHKIEEYTSVIGYVVFIPVFFVSIATSVRLDSVLKSPMIILLFVILGVLTKFLPVYLTSRALKLNHQDSLLIGTGMISRGEMALIVAQIGLAASIISHDLYSELVIVIILVTLLAPFFMKLAIKSKAKDRH